MKVKDLLTEETWCQNAYARDSAGKMVPADSDAAVKWCLVGACIRVYPNHDERQEAYDKIAHALGSNHHISGSYPVKPKLFVGAGAHDAGSFNDKSTWPEIKQLVEKADI